MLSSLRIQNLALVEDLSLDWGPGFTVLTGETGAGKSLLVDALSLLVGARGDSELVRHGAERATVEAVVEGRFEAWQAFLLERGLPDEQPVVLRREVGPGRSRAWINGASCALADLRRRAGSGCASPASMTISPSWGRTGTSPSSTRSWASSPAWSLKPPRCGRRMAP